MTKKETKNWEEEFDKRVINETSSMAGIGKWYIPKYEQIKIKEFIANLLKAQAEEIREEIKRKNAPEFKKANAYIKDLEDFYKRSRKMRVECSREGYRAGVREILEEIEKSCYPNKKAYGGYPFRESLYELEDNLHWIEGHIGKFLDQHDMLRVMKKYSKSIEKCIEIIKKKHLTK